VKDLARVLIQVCENHIYMCVCLWLSYGL